MEGVKVVTAKSVLNIFLNRHSAYAECLVFLARPGRLERPTCGFEVLLRAPPFILSCSPLLDIVRKFQKRSLPFSLLFSLVIRCLLHNYFTVKGLGTYPGPSLVSPCKQRDPQGVGVDIPKGVGLSTDRVLVGFNCRKGRTITNGLIYPEWN